MSAAGDARGGLVHARTRRRRIGWIAGCILLACCRGSAAGGDAADGADAAGRTAPLLHVDLAQRTAVQPIPAGVAAAPQKFVQIELAELHNPDRVPIAFEVRYRRAAGDEILLGTFSPFPPDEPGRFLVATRGELESGGAIAVSLVLLAESAPGQQVRASLRIALREK